MKVNDEDIVNFFGHPAVIEAINFSADGESSLVYRCLDGYGTWNFKPICKIGEQNPRRTDNPNMDNTESK